MLPQRASLIVIGGGIIGASVAYNLANKFSLNDIVVVEKARLGSASTSASLGGFRHQFSSELAIRLSIESEKILDKFEHDFGYDPLIKRDGYCFIASKARSLDVLKKNRELATRLGVKVELLDVEELERKFPFYSFKDIIGGTFCPEDGHASTSSVFQGYISKSKNLGVKFYENSEVTKILVDKKNSIDGVTVNGQVVKSNKVLIAAGAYSGTVGKLGGLEIPVKPYPRKILVTKSFSGPIPDEVPLIVDTDSTLALGREGKGIIFADNEPTESSFDLDLPSDYDQRIIQKACERVPALASASISYSVSGLYEMTPDSNPIISEIKQLEGLYCCTGFAGHGFMHAPAAGELMAEMIMEKKTRLDISSYDIQRFESPNPRSNENLII